MSCHSLRSGLRLTVVGRGPARPQPDTPASGLLVEHAASTILLDAGQGTVARLCRTRDPLELDAIVISHLHADHSVDLAALRYLVPWAGAEGPGLPVWLPPGGRAGLRRLAAAISERETFFEDGFELHEYEPRAEVAVGSLRLRFFAGRHYVPSFGVIVAAPDGTRIAYTADTGPSEAVAAAVAGVDLLVAEATLVSAREDEVERGHMTGAEAIALGTTAGAVSLLLTHFDTTRRAGLLERAARADRPVFVAEPGLSGIVESGAGFGPTSLASSGAGLRPLHRAIEPDTMAAGRTVRFAG